MADPIVYWDESDLLALLDALEDVPSARGFVEGTRKRLWENYAMFLEYQSRPSLWRRLKEWVNGQQT